MVSVATTVEERLNGLEASMTERLASTDERLARIETTLADIARKLHA
jgi:hypothetical protein